MRRIRHHRIPNIKTHATPTSAEHAMAQHTIKAAVNAIPAFLRLKEPHASFDYDREADVLYVSFERPQRADDSELLPEDILVRRRGKRLVGITVLRASRMLR